MSAPNSFLAPNPLPLTSATAAGTAGMRATILLALTFFATAPAAAEPATASEVLTSHLKRLEHALSTRPAVAEGPDQARWLRRLRFLRHLAGENAASEFRQRLDALEVLVRTGENRGLRTPDSKLTSPDKQGAVGGTVTAASSGAPLSDIFVLVWDEFGSLVDIASTEPSGTFGFADLVAGQYFATTENFDGYVDELYDDIFCPRGGFGGCDPTTGDPIIVPDQGTVQVDFALALGGSIAGTVTVTASGEPLPDIGVLVWNAEGDFVDGTFTDMLGRYQIGSLLSGTYFVTTENFGEYRDELYDDLPCPGFGCDPTTGTSVAVALETTTPGIDFALDQLGAITGRVTDELSGDPIPFVGLEAWDTQGSVAGFGFTGDSGQYLIGGLDEGTYFVFTSNSWGFDDELYDDLPCTFESCDPTTGTPIPVTLDATTAGIDFVLAGGCVETETVLCLNRDRFRVETSWRDFAGNTGAGQAVELTDDTGYFWFFAEANVELVVKALNACALPGFNNFWVFAGGLTSVEVTLTATDTRSGQSKSYNNTLATPFEPIQDTSAFNTCP